MEICKEKLKWTIDFSQMSDNELDRFIEHTSICKYHEKFLIEYENSFLPYLNAAFELSDEDKLSATAIDFLPEEIFETATNERKKYYISPVIDADAIGNPKKDINNPITNKALSRSVFKSDLFTYRSISYAIVFIVSFLALGVIFFSFFESPFKQSLDSEISFATCHGGSISIENPDTNRKSFFEGYSTEAKNVEEQQIPNQKLFLDKYEVNRTNTFENSTKYSEPTSITSLVPPTGSFTVYNGQTLRIGESTFSPDAPFISRQFGEPGFNKFTVVNKGHLTGQTNLFGVGVLTYYPWYADKPNDIKGFNQLQRGASPGGDWDDIGVVLFGGARLRALLNISADLGDVWNSNVRGELPNREYTLPDRPNKLHAAISTGFEINMKNVMEIISSSNNDNISVQIVTQKTIPAKNDVEVRKEIEIPTENQLCLQEEGQFGLTNTKTVDFIYYSRTFKKQWLITNYSSDNTIQTGEKNGNKSSDEKRSAGGNTREVGEISRKTGANSLRRPYGTHEEQE